MAAHSHMYVVLNFYDQIIFENHQKDTCLIKTCVLTGFKKVSCFRRFRIYLLCDNMQENGLGQKVSTHFYPG